jgi:predicted metal-binding membrane protein
MPQHRWRRGDFKTPLTAAAKAGMVRPMEAPIRQLSAAGLLAGAAVGAWALLTWMALDMGHPLVQLTMPGNPDWSSLNVAAMLLMWAAMMAAMMLPSALPMIGTFVRLNAQQGERGRALAFVAAYLLAWGAFSALATALQWLLQWRDWVDPMIVSTSPGLTALLLLVGGIYQFSPLKRTCLANCRTPVAFLLGEWRPGMGGAFAMGWRHGLQCLGCCWALMALLFVGGVMNIAWIAALTIAVAIEKMAPRGERAAQVLGAALIAAGVLRLVAMLAGAR